MGDLHPVDIYDLDIADSVLERVKEVARSKGQTATIFINEAIAEKIGSLNETPKVWAVN
jgi:hypothetical protein